MVLYEGDTFPEAQNPEWARTVFCTPERSIDNGWLVQDVRFIDCTGEGGESDRYIRSLAPYVGADRLFCEWQVQTNGPSTEIIGSSPANIVVANLGGAIDYHFTIASDLVRLIRDDDLPYVYAELETDVPHHYRLELDNVLNTYAWFIDGLPVDAGTAEGAFPNANGVITFRAKSWDADSISRWNFIRFGDVPDQSTGDFDTDGDVDLLDYFLFADYSSGPSAQHKRGWEVGDFDLDVDIDLADFAEFQVLFAETE